MSHLRRTAALVALLTFLAACGGGADDPGDAGEADSEAAQAASEAAVDDTATEVADDEPAAEVSSEPAADGRAGGGGSGGESIIVESVGAFGLDLGSYEPTAWTYLVYSMADTNLEEPMLDDILELAAVGSTDEVNVIALVDREEGHTDADLLNIEDFETGKLFYVYEDELEEMADLGEIDMADPHVLADFIAFGLTTFPADNVALTISDHGGGWTGMGPDDSSGEVMDLIEIESAIAAGLEAAGGGKISLLGFDACLMATYENAATLAPYADYLLASEELEPGHGWDYRSLGVAAEDPDTDAETLGRTFVQGFAGQANERGTGAEITLSLVDLNAMDGLTSAMDDFALTLSDQAEALGVLIGRQRAENVSYGRSPNPEQSTQLTDLGQFISEIGVASLQVSDQADAVLRAINDVVVDQTVGPGRLGSTGLSIYFPPTLELTNGAYAAIPAAQPWIQFLLSYYGSGYAIPPEGQPAVAGESRSGGASPAPGGLELGAEAPGGEVVYGEAEVFDVEGGVEVSVQLDPASLGNVVEATLSFGYIDPDDGAIVQLGDTQAEIGEDGTVFGFTDLTVLTLTDGDGNGVDAYLSLEYSDDGSLGYASIPLDYAEPGSEFFQPVDLTIVVDAESGDVLQEIYYLIDEEAGSYGELAANPEASIAPVVLVFAEDQPGSWDPFGDAEISADLPNLAYDFAPLDPGTEIYVDLTITDYGGNTLIASAIFDS